MLHKMVFLYFLLMNLSPNYSFVLKIMGVKSCEKQNLMISYNGSLWKNIYVSLPSSAVAIDKYFSGSGCVPLNASLLQDKAGELFSVSYVLYFIYCYHCID